MPKIAVQIKIDVKKIEKARLFQGATALYLDSTVFIDLGEADQYGNHGMVTQDVSKEEREAGTRGPILGNVKIFWRDDSPVVTTSRVGNGQPPPLDFDEDIPF